MSCRAMSRPIVHAAASEASSIPVVGSKASAWSGEEMGSSGPERARSIVDSGPRYQDTVVSFVRRSWSSGT